MNTLLLLAAALPLSGADPSLECYATMTEAAQEGLRAAVALGGDRAEAGGAVYSHGVLFCYTAPVTQGLSDAVDYRVGLVAPDKLVALFHTHPGPVDLAERFSRSDLALAHRLGLPMYVMVVEIHKVITYRARPGRRDKYAR